MWLYPESGEALDLPLAPMPDPESTVWGREPLASDVQYLLILDQYYNWIDTLLWMRDDSSQWEYIEFDLEDYAGWFIYLQWGTYNDGWGGITSMYVDDVSLQVCP
jgi:hypothetical protein